MIKVLDYGAGNVKAITNIYKRLKIACDVATDEVQLNGADKLIVPGVGAFDETMALLENSGMLERLHEMVVHEQVPVLGVCVGMQVMANGSEEGSRAGLGWIDGFVKRMDCSNLTSKPKLPHMGWNSITSQQEHPILTGIDLEQGFYFLHSFCFSCSQPEHVLTTSYYGEEFTSAVVSDNVYGFQFHPEKSHMNGIRVFQNFAEI